MCITVEIIFFGSVSEIIQHNQEFENQVSFFCM